MMHSLVFDLIESCLFYTENFELSHANRVRTNAIYEFSLHAPYMIDSLWEISVVQYFRIPTMDNISICMRPT